MDNASAAEQPVDRKKKKKKDKVRSAWISFAGRIVAQVVGAIATVALGVMVLHRYTSTNTPPASEYLRPAASATEPGQAVHVIVLTPAMLGLRGEDARGSGVERSCAPTFESPATSVAHLGNPALLPR